MVPPPTLFDQFGPLMVVFLKVIVMGRVRPFLTPRVQFFSLFLLKDFTLALSLFKNTMLRKRLVKKKIENISERHDRATTTAIAADPRREPEKGRRSGRARESSRLSPLLLPPVGVPPEGDEPTGHEDESQ